jgi:predicted glycosyltransferase
MSEKPSLLFYCHHSVGIGHISRSLRIAEALLNRFRVLVISGGKLPKNLRVPGDLEIVQLPPVGITGDGELTSLDRRWLLKNAMSARARMILNVFKQRQPRVLLIEFFPFGRVQFVGEITPLLRAAAKVEPVPPLVLCSIRDIMEQKSRRGRRGLYDHMACSVTNSFYDGILVHSDPHLFKLEDTFNLFHHLEVPVHYTGYIVQDTGKPMKVKLGDKPVVVSVGGGRVGGNLLRCAIEGYKSCGFPRYIRLILSAGPFLPEFEWKSLREMVWGIKGVKLCRWLTNLRDVLARAGVSVSQCGYNTTMDLLATGVPALVVPYESPGDSEQRLRAEKLESMGLVRMLAPAQLTPKRLVEEIKKTLDFKPAPHQLNLEGVSNTSKMLETLLENKRQKNSNNLV